MIVPLLALSMLAALSQQHNTHNAEAPATTARPPADAEAANAAANGEATEAADAAARAAEAAAADEAAAAGEDVEDEVCRRVTSYDDFGRRRTRRVCTPR